MILNKICEKYSKLYGKVAFGLVFGIVFGLAVGLAYGLAVGLAGGLAGGLAYGLAGGLAVGLAYGLAVGLAYGLAGGLAVGLAYGLAGGLAGGTYPLIPALIFLVIITEIFFWFDTKKIKPKQSKIWFTVEREAEAALESTLIIGAYPYLKYVWENYAAIQQFIIQYGIYPLMFFGVVGLVGIWIWLNSWKYREKKAIRNEKQKNNNRNAESGEKMM